MAKVTAPKLRAMKAQGERIVCLTAYDVLSASLAEAAGVDVVLVGDSLGNVILGYDTTVPVTLVDVIHHLRPVARVCDRALVVGDLPFGSYGASIEETVQSAVAVMQAGAEAVKLEGPLFPEVEALVRLGIPVMGHLGMTPQSVNQFGGFKVQGRDNGAALIEAARGLEEAGAFGIVLELIPSGLAGEISRAISIPTIGIGGGLECDGEIQVFHDILGLGEREFRHTRWFVRGRELLARGVGEYVEAVRARTFPGPEQSV